MTRTMLLAALTATASLSASAYELSDVAGSWDCEQGNYERGAWMRGYYTIDETGAASLTGFFREIEGEDTTKVRYEADLQISVEDDTLRTVPQAVRVASAEFNGEEFDAGVRDVFARILMTPPSPGTIETASQTRLVYKANDTLVTCMTRDETKSANAASVSVSQLSLRGRCETGDCK